MRVGVVDGFATVYNLKEDKMNLKDFGSLALITVFWYLVFAYLFMSFNPNDFVSILNGNVSCNFDMKIIQVVITLYSCVFWLIAKSNKEA